MLIEYLGFLIPILVALGIFVHSQLDEYRRKIRFLEIKVDTLIQHTGIEFDDNSLVPIEIH